MLISHLASAQQEQVVYDMIEADLLIPEKGRVEFYDLFFGVVPTTYLKANDTEHNEINAQRIISDVASLKRLNNLGSSHQGVQIIQINVKSLADLEMLSEYSGLEGFRSCKYIYLNCTFEICPGSSDTKCEKDLLMRYLQKLFRTDLIIFYSSSLDQ